MLDRYRVIAGGGGSEQEEFAIKLLITSVCAIFAWVCVAGVAVASGGPGHPEVSGSKRIVVKLRPGVAVADLAGGPGVSIAASGATGGPRVRQLGIDGGGRLATTLRKLRDDPRVVWAVRERYAHLSSLIPNDPGTTTEAGGWQKTQWESLRASGVNSPDAWANLNAAGRPGGQGVVVAVIDTGIAYRNFRDRDAGITFKRAPDFSSTQFVTGLSMQRGLPAIDTLGHGTWVASIIAASTGNARLLTGIAYGAKLMPIATAPESTLKVAATDLARGTRYAADHGAQVINMSLGFGPFVRAKDVPQIVDAIDYAYAKGVVMVAASGNSGEMLVEIPARLEHVIGVGATTESGCLADYSNAGVGLDLVAPGGGRSEGRLNGQAGCDSFVKQRKICQQTYKKSLLEIDSLSDLEDLLEALRRDTLFSVFDIECHEGTSGSAPIVAGTAALVIASGILGPNPNPDVVTARLKKTATDLGQPGEDQLYGAGRVNAAAATDPLFQ